LAQAPWGSSIAGEPVRGTLIPSGNGLEASTVEAVSRRGMTIA
jgi:hypothetical protein